VTWTAHTESLAAGTTRLAFDERGKPLSRDRVRALLAEEAAFRSFFARTLADVPYDAFFWECPPTTRAAQHAPFECVLIDAPPLARIRADHSDFDPRFESSPGLDVLAFPNLGRDATLVVPAPRTSDDAYGHLGAFVRRAPATQIDALFSLLARTIDARLSSAPLWVSTAGLGVAWLHVRLDARPKYYRHAPYKHTS
jgi:hypothetical protein